MNKLWAALALAGAGCLASSAAQAEPVKIAIIETLSRRCSNERRQRGYGD